MRLLVLTLFFFVACGKDSSSTKQTRTPQVDPYIDEYTESKGIDLLEARINVPVTISNGEIMINGSRSETQKGDVSTCSVSVNYGERMSYNVIGEKLYLRNSAGTETVYERAGYGTDPLIGAWTLQVKKGKTNILKTFSVVDYQTIVMREKCEQMH